MERLTFTKEQRDMLGVEYAKYINPCSMLAWDKKLAAYEDTGLTPGEVTELVKAKIDRDICGLCIKENICDVTICYDYCKFKFDKNRFGGGEMYNKYLVRGKCLYDGKWIQGYYVNENGKHKILTNTDDGIDIVSWVEIDTITIGQCTGVRDKNGELIFEGDILKGKLMGGEIKLFEVEWDIFCCHVVGTNSAKTCNISPPLFSATEVVGNVWDNPELSEVNNDTL